MSLATLYSRASHGIKAPLITIEVHISAGLPAFSIVGLPETSVKEARDRVRSALLTAGFELPARRITVNLAPADLPKEGGRFDLAIALGILAASGQIPGEALDRYEFAAELALDGSLRGTRGIIPLVVCARQAGRKLVLASENGDEAGVISEAEVYTAAHLLEVTAAIIGQQRLPLVADRRSSSTADGEATAYPDLRDVQGQPMARRALEIAAAGQHHVLLFGPPGTGKTMLASRLPGILPEMNEPHALESAAVMSVSHQGFSPAQWQQRPYRAPHHSCSAVALVGGGNPPRPGEISLAHQGVLFLDELTEFDRKVLESLREPLESGHITISRAARQAEFPARFQLVAAMNPSPCGHWGDPNAPSRSSPDQVKRYLSKLSGPFLDRFDLTVDVPKVPIANLHQPDRAAESSDTVKQRVVAAWHRSQQRRDKPNAALTPSELALDCALSDADQRFLVQVSERLGLSARAHHRILRVARTIADLGTSRRVERSHLSEAISYRAFDRLLKSLDQTGLI